MRQGHVPDGAPSLIQLECCAASMGPFTVNLWERANATDQDGDLFEYIYSHSAYATREDFASVDAFHPNQVRLTGFALASPLASLQVL